MTLSEIKEGSVLLIDKPIRWSSFDVVKKVSLLARPKKVGHAGTLDPLASGLMIILTGSKTKEMLELNAGEKEYTGTFFMGASTESHDLERPIDATFPISHITDEMIFQVAKSMIGSFAQTPPLHSAKKRDGVRYYKMARRGEEFQRIKSWVELKEFEITRIQLPEIDFRIVCSKGFYVRSLAHDFGEKLLSGAHITALRRIRSGNFNVKDAWTIESFMEFVLKEKENYQNESLSQFQ